MKKTVCIAALFLLTIGLFAEPEEYADLIALLTAARSRDVKITVFYETSGLSGKDSVVVFHILKSGIYFWRTHSPSVRQTGIYVPFSQIRKVEFGPPGIHDFAQAYEDNIEGR